MPERSRKRFFNRRRQHDPPGEGHACTWRSRCFKVAVEITTSARRVLVKLASSRPHLDELFALAPEGAELILHRLIDRYPSSKAGLPTVNLRTTFEKIIIKAGCKPWPKLWHNLRASAQTDLAARFPRRVVCSWINNSTVSAATLAKVADVVANKLKHKSRRITEMIVQNGGRVAIDVVANDGAVGWQAPYSDAVQNYRRRVNPKLTKFAGVEVVRRDNELRFQEPAPKARKTNAPKKRRRAHHEAAAHYLTDCSCVI